MRDFALNKKSFCQINAGLPGIFFMRPEIFHFNFRALPKVLSPIYRFQGCVRKRELSAAKYTRFCLKEIN